MTTESRMWAVLVRGHEARSGWTGNPVVTEEGEWFVVVTEPEGWVEATANSIGHGKPTELFSEWLSSSPSSWMRVKLFKSHDAAEKFARRWSGHPWYCKPTGEFVAVEVEPVYKEVIDAWRIVE